MAEYAQTYGHLPAPDSPWGLFLSLARKASQFWARRQLVTFDAVASAVALLGGDSTEIMESRTALELEAWPVSKTSGPTVIQNAWGESDG